MGSSAACPGSRIPPVNATRVRLSASVAAAIGMMRQRLWRAGTLPKRCRNAAKALLHRVLEAPR